MFPLDFDLKLNNLIKKNISKFSFSDKKSDVKS